MSFVVFPSSRSPRAIRSPATNRRWWSPTTTRIDAAEARTDQLRSLYGLDRNFVLRFFTWLVNFLRGEFGVSFNNFRPVSDLIGQRLLYSIAISSSALIFMYVVGVPIGLWTAYRQYGVSDYAVSVVAFIGLSIPNFFLALLVLVIGTEGLAKIVRITRANMLDGLQDEYVRTARAKGLAEPAVVLKHAFRVAVNPLISLFGMQFPLILSGEVVGSIVLGLPTLGPLLLDSLRSLDLYVSTTILMVLGILLLIGNLLADVLLALAYPRIRFD